MAIIQATPAGAIELIDSLDEDGETYHFVRTGDLASGQVELRLQIDGFNTGHAIVLRKDGTWQAFVNATHLRPL